MAASSARLLALFLVPALAALGGIDFDVQRYLGQWHQVAATPAWFQSDCVADTTADYALAEDGGITVANFCHAADGELKQAEGMARFTGTGADVMKRIATPLVGGILTSGFTVLVIMPIVYYLWRGIGIPKGPKFTGFPSLKELS